MSGCVYILRMVTSAVVNDINKAPPTAPLPMCHLSCPVPTWVHDCVEWPWPPLPTIYKHMATQALWNIQWHTFFFFVAHAIVTPLPLHLSLTHTHLFPFPLRQLCCSLSIVEAGHFHMCAGHKKAKSRLKASLSWLAGSQFVSYKHRTHLSPTVCTYPSDPLTS